MAPSLNPEILGVLIAYFLPLSRNIEGAIAPPAPPLPPALQGEAELRILDFKTTWLKFQKPIQTTGTQGKAELLMYIQPSRNLTSPESVPSSCVRNGYLLVKTKLAE